MECNNYPIKEAIIIEDSGKMGIDDFAYDILKNIPTKIIYNEKNMGLRNSILKGIQYIKTDLVFYCQDDWHFFSGGFIEQSLTILKKDNMVTCVSLIPYNKYKNVVVDMTDRGGYRYAMPRDGIGGYTENPGLRYLKIFEPYKELISESKVSRYYHKKGMLIGFTMKTKGFVRHSGHRNSAFRKYPEFNIF